ncbi:hypothetical protein Nepgr_005052 [Nepenthes gracilis]|uniref:Uncharacterized protein n=1 Tax=Nepenthes gracilis TaxID=150966 RepID=A0AAD3S2G7_NEPGR|nr:hypothetical protein Nepgr_005052 [Nepenthes gracilis]
MGRAPCCDKANVKKGPWSPEEDAKLKSFIEQHGTGGNWIALPQKIGLKRCGKSCRLRWLNYLRPNIKHGGFSEEEDKVICSLYVSIGSRWSIIAAQLPGRTDNDIKNYWNTRLKKKLLGKQRKEYQAAGRSKGNIMRIKQENYCNSRIMGGQNNQTMSSTFLNNQMVPYWPELPEPVAPFFDRPEPAHFNDHTSVRKLLIKLGGSPSSDGHPCHGCSMNLQCPPDLITYSATTPDMINQRSADMISPSVQIDCQFETTGYGNAEGVAMGIVPQESGWFPPDIEELMCSNVEGSDGGLEFLCSWDDHMMVNNGTQLSWKEMSSPISLDAAPSDYDRLPQGMAAFDGDQLSSDQ